MKYPHWTAGLLRLLLALAMLCLPAFGAHAQNLLVNGDFESNPPPNNGNNIGYSVSPWVTAGSTPNVTTVDGPGGYDYGYYAPESDASAPGAGIAQHYLDIAGGSNNFYQSFTVDCSGEVTFGGAFATEMNKASTATISLLNGSGLGGSVVATLPVALPGGTSKTDPWTTVGSTANVVAGQTYTIAVHMDDFMAFDNGFVHYTKGCSADTPSILKICKVAGDGVDMGTDFIFGSNTIPGAPGTSTIVPAGPAPGGYCKVAGSYATGTNVSVHEAGPPGYTVTSIGVEPPSALSGTPDLGNGTVNVVTVPGVTEVTFTNERHTGYVEVCKTGNVTGNYTFMVDGIGNVTVPAGACSPALQVSTGPLSITEITPGATMDGCSTVPAGRQVSCNLTSRVSIVTIVPGDISTQTIATIDNAGCVETPAHPCVRSTGGGAVKATKP